MHRFIIVFIALLVTLPSVGQNYIGIHKDEIRRVIAVEYEGFIFDNEVVNAKKSFIKFVDNDKEQTIIFVLDNKGVCTSVLHMYNSWMYDRVKKELKKQYSFDGIDRWSGSKNGEEFEVEIKKGKWFLTVITRKKR